MRPLIATLTLIVLVCVPSIVQAAGLPTTVVPVTQVVTFHPAGTTGAPVTGNCWTESIALQRADAWRCMIGNGIFDPCFSAKAHATTVICNAYPTHPRGITVHLSSPLPTHSASPSTRPWALVLGDGTYCVAFTGTITLYHGLPMDYGCGHQWNVVGGPVAQGKLWYATVVALNKSYQPVNVFLVSVKDLYH